MSFNIEIPNAILSATQKELLFTLMMADNANIHSHRLGEWCGHGPVIEQDIALTNISLDHLGAARSFYQYAAALLNAMPRAEKESLFTSPLLQQKIDSGSELDEDDLAFLRDAWDYRNVLLVEQPNTDFAYTVVRCFMLDVFHYYFYQQLAHHANKDWAAIAAKSLKEVAYHLKWSSEWMIRLGDGTNESHDRIQTALNDLWPFSGELFALNDILQHVGLQDVMPTIHEQWKAKVNNIVAEATLQLPAGTWMQEGGKEGKHSEHLGYLLADMQFLQRAYPGMKW